MAYMTQEDRESIAIVRMRTLLADGIAERKAIHRLNNEQIGRGLEIGERTIGRVLEGADVKLTISQIMRLLRFAGIELRRKER